MSSFRFPPPPPAPPKASSSDTLDAYNSQRGGRGDRGDRGRGRGGSGRGRGRGRGRGDIGGIPRGGQGRGNTYNRGGARGGWQDQHHAHATAPGMAQQPFNSHTTPSSNTFPSTPSTYINPSLANPPAAADPTAFVQAMSFMATPAGMQSMNAFASHMSGTNPVPGLPQYSPSPQVNHSPPGQGACKTRRNERAMKWQTDSKDYHTHNSQNLHQKPPRAKAKAAPAVPSFGFSIPSASISQSSSHRREDGRNDVKRRKLNLGLTQQQNEDEPESDSEEDVDEEAAWASNEKLKNGIVFEHEGEKISLQTQAEIAAWRKDRKKNFPTQQRVMEKAQEAAERRALELEFLRKISGKSKPKGSQLEPEPGKEHRNRNNAQNKSDTELSASHRQVHENVEKEGSQPVSFVSEPRKIDLGLGYGTDSDAEESSCLSGSSVLSSDSESDSDDEAPVPISSKIVVNAPAPVAAPPAKRPAPKPRNEKIDVCPQWKERGTCKYGHKCKYPHTSETKVIGLYERMVEQELEKRDRIALDAIKFLGRNGFLG